MGDSINLDDPAFEPTDEQLQGLSSRAFAGVRAAHAESLDRLREAIASERVKVLEALALAVTTATRPPA
jgi:hypothetical protein